MAKAFLNNEDEEKNNVSDLELHLLFYYLQNR